MANLYKYMSADIADVLLVNDNQFSIKFSHLHEYNDPYEFFLTIDYQRPAQELAFYNEMIGMVLQQPVSCFSKSPVNIPMWAHYANNSTGFVLEIDEDKLDAYIAEAGFYDLFSINDITYRDTPLEGIEETLQRAYHLCKPRYIGFLQRYIRSSAYLLKKSCWSYELERRIVIDKRVLTKINDNLMILSIPLNCIKSMVIGSKADDSLISKLTEISMVAHCKIYQMIIGRSTTNPYLINERNITFCFDDSEITEQDNSCHQCFEPVDSGQKVCAWCAITDDDRVAAAHRNSFRMLDRMGTLEGYLERFDQIGRKKQ